VGSPPAAEGAVVAPAGLLRTDFSTFRRSETLREEIFGPAALFVTCTDIEQLMEAPSNVHGSLATAVYASDRDAAANVLVNRLLEKAGRIVWNGVTTGVRVAQPMVHGGPFPATNRPDSTAVGPDAIQRWTRPVCFQNLPVDVLPSALRRA
jgi:NADP-dependent aldehyde dehydrogenase